MTVRFCLLRLFGLQLHSTAHRLQPKLFGLRLHSQPIGCTDLPFPVFSVLRFRRIRVSRGLACSRVWCPSRCPRLRPRARSPALGGAESSRRRLRHPSTIDVGAHSWAASATLRGFCHPFRRYPPLAGVPRGDGKPHAPQPRTLLTPLWRSSRPAKVSILYPDAALLRTCVPRQLNPMRPTLNST